MNPINRFARTVFIGLFILLTACGGGGGGDHILDNTDSLTAGTPVAGGWKDDAYLGAFSLAELEAGIQETSRTPDGFTALYPVNAYRLRYYTTDIQGRLVLASGLVAVPQKAGLPSPVLSYQHGTIYQNAEAPGNHAVATEPAILMASQGYIVMAADYVGYGETQGRAHPYLLAEPSAASVVDFIQAAHQWMQVSLIADNGQLFMTGYSEGGYVTMAAHRFLQSANPTGLTLVATVPGAGPYDVVTTLDELVRREGVNPDYLEYLPAYLRNQLRDLLLKELLSSGTDIVFDTTFLDDYLAGRDEELERNSNVHDWRPAVPVRLHHGVDDEAVPYASAVSTLTTMLARGADVALVDCTASPSTHSRCVPSWLGFTFDYFSGLAHNL